MPGITSTEWESAPSSRRLARVSAPSSRRLATGTRHRIRPLRAAKEVAGTRRPADLVFRWQVVSTQTINELDWAVGTRGSPVSRSN
jgi:hypothetical protein